jgi:hypothetical protein
MTSATTLAGRTTGIAMAVRADLFGGVGCDLGCFGHGLGGLVRFLPFASPACCPLWQAGVAFPEDTQFKSLSHSCFGQCTPIWSEFH